MSSISGPRVTFQADRPSEYHWASASQAEIAELTSLPWIDRAVRQLGPIAVHLPERVETNDLLQQEYPNWDIKLIAEKTGIHQRHIAAEGETSSDLAVAAAESLFATENIDRESIDFLLLCTQTPDYPLPTTSCLIQNRLGLPTRCGALDFNLVAAVTCTGWRWPTD